MSDTRLKPPRRKDSGPLTTLRPLGDTATGRFVRWKTMPPRGAEAVRWESVDGRWVALELGHGASLGLVLVTDSTGRCESVASYEDALQLANSWRT